MIKKANIVPISLLLEMCYSVQTTIKSNYDKIFGTNTEKVLTWICQSSIDVSDLHVSETNIFLFKLACL